MKESEFQKKIIDRLKKEFPGCVVIKNDPTYIQGFPDLLILYENFWIALEVKRSKASSKRPNQEYWIKKLNRMSYAFFIYPENEEEIINEIQETFRALG